MNDDDNGANYGDHKAHNQTRKFAFLTLEKLILNKVFLVRKCAELRRFPNCDGQFIRLL